MNESKNANPTIVARETLKQLATLKIPPTPDNYYKLYNQISGVSDNSVEASSLSNDATANQTIDNTHSISGNPLNWGETLEVLLKQLESKHGKLTIAKKREGVTRVLSKFSKDSNQLHIKLKGLIDSWEALVVAPHESPQDDSERQQKASLELVPSEVEPVITEVGNTQKLLLKEQDVQFYTDQIVDIAGQILDRIVARQTEDITLSEEAKELAHQIRQVSSQSELTLFVTCFQQFCSNFNAYDKDQKTLRQGLLKLLGMLMDSTGELLAGDQWVKTQIDKLRVTMSKPLNQAVIEEAEQCLGVITQKQDQIRLSLNEAKTTLKQMVTSIITNIEELTDATGEYQEKLGDYSDKISKADDISDMNHLLRLIVDETKQMQKNAHSYRNDFLAARAEVSKAQEKINQLETDLMEMGEKVHEDHLTGILNRRGLDSAFMRETARSVRHHVPLCYALLDIDNFKQLNDTHGHKVGDDALIYLVQSIKETTRPEDVVSRYGGEEFVVLLPNTEKEEAFEVLSRIRRNLTKKFFLYDNNRLLITFSAGIAQFNPGESQESIFKRADEALYRAKRSGKNQMLIAE